MTTLPSLFFLYFPFRHSQADPHSGFVLVDAVKDGAAWRITPRAVTADIYTVSGLTAGVVPTSHFTQNVHHETTPGLVLLKTFLYYGSVNITDSYGSHVAVIEMTKHTTVFTSRLKRNVQFPSPSPPPPAPKPITTSLSAHVARQLLELARLKREQCPIIMEDLMEGHTAVMPCGHLFSRLAMEESFKKEPNVCPACRQHGQPTLA